MLTGQDGIRRRRAIQFVAEMLAEPARTMLGYQDLVGEHVNALGLVELVPDVERTLIAARELNELIEQLATGEWNGDELDNQTAVEARIRHDLRTPLNAILGYSEMVLEELDDTVPRALHQDISLVLAHARALLDQIDQIRDVSGPDADKDSIHGDREPAVSILAIRPDGPLGAGASPETGRILVIDDVASNRDLLERRLSRDGHAVTCAASGRDALRELEGIDFDLVLLDVLMPDMNGIELLARMKSEARWRNIPVIMISGLKETETVIRCIEAGAEDYLPKPFDPVLLRARIAASLERKQWRDREQDYLQRIEFEKDRAATLLAAILPEQIVTRLNDGEKVIADRMEEATILFADIVGFTRMASQWSPSEIVERLSEVFKAIDRLAVEHRVEKIKTIGDAYMAASGIPEPNPDNAEAMVSFAVAMLEAIRRIDPEFQLRIGIHTGPIVAGLIGESRFIYDIWGHTVNVASRLEALSSPNRIMISDATFQRLGGRYQTEPEQSVELKGAGKLAAYLIA